MEQTRTSIRDTVEELRGRVSDAVDWRQYVGRYPAASLAVAAAAGLLLGRGLAALVMRDGEKESAAPSELGGYRGAEVYQESGVGESRFGTAASRAAQSAQAVAQSAYHAAEPALAGARRAVGQSVARLGSRAEGILNRLIDELTDAVETHLVPGLIDRFRGLIDLDRRGRRPAGRGAGVRGEVYTGGPVGSGRAAGE